MELSINIKSAIHKIGAGLVLLLVTTITGFFLSMPIPVIYKLALILLPAILLLFVLNQFGMLILFFLFRPELQLFRAAGVLKIFSASVIIFALFVFTTTHHGRFDFSWDRFKYLYLFVLVSIISLVYSIDHKESLYAILKLLSFISIYLLAFNLIKSQKNGIKLLTCLPLAAVLPLIYGFYQLSTGQVYVIAATGIQRFSSFFVLANIYSRFLFVIFLASIPLFVYINKRNKFLLALFLIFIITTIGLLGIREIWILVVFSFLIIARFLPEIRRQLIITITAFALILLVGGLFMKGVKTITSPDIHRKYGDSIYLRLDMWEQIVTKAVPQKPILGFGAGTSEEVVDTYTTVGSLIPHNEYLRVLVETGVFGLIPYVLFLISNIVLSYKDIAIYKENKYLNVCAFTLFSCVGISMLATNISQGTDFMWYFFGYLGITHKLNYLSQLS